ncbi:MAG: lysine--tRNA ligase [Candidatus Diapherotrites archaeon]|nr:lysine--tRNA ligase [Candidatus Diapherotrites archaeon]
MEEFFWAEKAVDEITAKKKSLYVCEGMWTPSGFFHIGNARPEIFTPYSVFVVLKDRGFKARQNFIIDDFDAVRKIPSGLGVPKEREPEFLGFPCAVAQSPVKGFPTWAEFFVSDVRRHVEEFGVPLNIVSAYDTYKKGLFNGLISFSLDHAADIAGVWNRIAGADKEGGFLPVQVVCPDCGRLYFTKALSWDGKKVGFECSACNAKGEVSPFNGAVKLHWRVHWVCHWIVHDVAFESGGKDHFSRGGSVEVGHALIREVFRREPPVQFPTEFIQFKGAKMSGSVGNVISLGQWLEAASPELFRFMNLSTRPQRVLEFSFDPDSFFILDERFLRAERVFFGEEKAENEKIGRQLKRAYSLSLLSKPPVKMPVQVSFSFAVFLSQLVDPAEDFEKILGILSSTGHVKGSLPVSGKKALKARFLRAKKWVEKYAPVGQRVGFVEKLDSAVLLKIRPEVRALFSVLAEKIGKIESADEVQKAVFELSKSSGVEPKELFEAMYLVLIGANRGPKIGSLVFALGKDKTVKRLSEVK